MWLHWEAIHPSKLALLFAFNEDHRCAWHCTKKGENLCLPTRTYRLMRKSAVRVVLLSLASASEMKSPHVEEGKKHWHLICICKLNPSLSDSGSGPRFLGKRQQPEQETDCAVLEFDILLTSHNPAVYLPGAPWSETRKGDKLWRILVVGDCSSGYRNICRTVWVSKAKIMRWRLGRWCRVGHKALVELGGYLIFTGVSTVDMPCGMYHIIFMTKPST